MLLDSERRNYVGYCWIVRFAGREVQYTSNYDGLYPTKFKFAGRNAQIKICVASCGAASQQLYNLEQLIGFRFVVLNTSEFVNLFPFKNLNLIFLVDLTNQN